MVLEMIILPKYDNSINENAEEVDDDCGDDCI